MIYIIDTYAWIEYFKGSDRGKVLKDLFYNQSNKFITMECCIAELCGYCLRNKIEFIELYSIVKGNSIILPVMRSHWIQAAKIKFELGKKIAGFGLIDSILLAKQEEMHYKIVSGDTHFKNLKNIVYLNK